MKTKIPLSAIFAILLFIVGSGSLKLNAQTCDVVLFKNNTGCNIIVSYNYSCVSPSFLCAGASNVTITPGNAIPLTSCGVNCGACTISATLNFVGTTAVGITVTDASPNNNYTPIPACSAIGNMYWSGNSVVVE
jgi:hypothetical protein